jgi:hypothetical protein
VERKMLTSRSAANTSNKPRPLRPASSLGRTLAPAPAARFGLWPRLSRLERQALVMHGVAEAAAWHAFFEGLPMSWLEVQA